MLKQTFDQLARPFIGSGITSRFPFLHKVFFWLYPKIVGNQTKIFPISVPPVSFKLKAYLKDANTGIYLSTTGSYEPMSSKLMVSLLSSGDTVIDVGANIGYFSHLASQVVGESGKIIAFEPDQSVIPLLYENIQLNNAKNITVETVALSDHTGEAYLQAETVHLGHAHLAQSGQPVKLVQLADYLKANNLRPKLIKMDIEGAEVQALKGLGIIRDCHLIIEVNKESLRDFDLTVSDLMNQIKSCGFTPHIIIDETKKQLIPYSKETFDAMLARVHYTNLHCIS